MINYYFGLPGSGKTTHLVKTALKENVKIIKGKSRFKRVLTNVRLTPPKGVPSHIYYFDNDDFGKYDMSDSLILFDETQMMFDNRDYAKMKPHVRNFLMLHRHYRTTLYFYNQTYDSCDKKIRLITNNVYYIRRSIITGGVSVRRIKYLMYIPKKPRRSDIVDNTNGDIVMRYYQSGFFEHLFSSLFIETKFRISKYFKYFDSYDAPALPIKEFELMEVKE